MVGQAKEARMILNENTVKNAAHIMEIITTLNDMRMKTNNLRKHKH